MSRKRKIFIRLITLGDQGMFAVGNFLLTILLTRYYNDIDLAAYGIAISIALVLQGVQKNSYLIQNAVLDSKIYRKRGKKILGEHMIAVFPIFFVLSVISAFIILFAPEAFFFHTIVATTVCFAIYAQLEFERYVFIKYERFIIPFITSFCFAGLVIGFLFFHDSLSFYGVMVILWLFACLKTSVAFLIVGGLDLKGGLILLCSDFRRNSLGSLMGVIGSSGYTHGPVIALGLFSSPLHAAAFVAMRSLMQPIQIIMRSMDVIDKNFFRSKVTNGDAGIIKVMKSQIIMYGLVSASIALVISVLGTVIINFLYDGEYIEFIYVLYGWAIISVFTSMTLPIESAIVVKKLLNKYNFIRLWIGISVVTLAIVIIAPYGAYAALALSGVALFIAMVAGVFILFIEVRKNRSLDV